VSVFYAIGNCAKSASPFALLGYKKNGDRRATGGGAAPLFYKKIIQYIALYG
jgi:hypothetical protein